MNCCFLCDHGQSKVEARFPLKQLQMLASEDLQQNTMSTTRKYGLNNYHVPRSSRLSKQADTSSITRLNTLTKPSMLPKPDVCDKAPSSSSKPPQILDSSNEKVQSLMSSPKWSRIKDKFESSESNSSLEHISSRPTRCTTTTSSYTHSSRPVISKGNLESKYTTRSRTQKADEQLHSGGVSRSRVSTYKDSVVNQFSHNNVSKNYLSKDVPEESSKINNLRDVFTVDGSSSKTASNSGNLKSLHNKKVTKKPFHSGNTNSLSSLPVHRGAATYKSSVLSSPKYSLAKKVELNQKFRPSSPSRESRINTRLKSQQAYKSLDSKGNSIKRKEIDSSTKNVLSFTDNNINSTTNKVLPSQIKEQNNKNLWVKDNFGNWTKNSASGITKVGEESNVSILRNKFSSKHPESETSHFKNPLQKSKTEGNVPLTTAAERNNKLIISRTTDSIFQSSHDSTNSASVCDDENNSYKSSTSCSSNGDHSEQTSCSFDECSSVQSRRLSAVQRAVLSYEENLSVLSPETQRKLKLLGEKVKSENAEDALVIDKKVNVFPSNNMSDHLAKTIDKPVQYNSDKKQVTDISMFGERLLPIHNYLSDYRNKYNQRTSDENTGDSAVQEQKKKDWGSAVRAVNSVANLKTSTINVSELAKHFSSQNGTKESLTKESIKNNAKPVTKQDIESKSLKPNSSFLWREAKNSFFSNNVKVANGNNHNYYVLENYHSETDSNSSNNAPSALDSRHSLLKLTGGEACYQNVEEIHHRRSDDAWTDMSDEDLNKSTSSRSSTLKKRKNRNSHVKENLCRSWSQSFRDVISAQNDARNSYSSDKLESDIPADNSYTDHLYEPVYESLGSYMVSDENNEKQFSPDDDQMKDIYSSYTSLESLQSEKISSEPDKNDEKLPEPPAGKKTSKIQQLRRHLSWSKSDIKLELSSKFNKIKIKKNGHNDTEIGVKVQENETTCTSPKKNTFIKCILKQKSCNNIPVKKSLSPKKESALFYVHLSMTREKQRPFSDSCVGVDISGNHSFQDRQSLQETGKSAEPSVVPAQVATRRGRKNCSKQVIQRPKTPPPLPPTSARNSLASQKSSLTSMSDFTHESNNLYSECSLNNESFSDSPFNSVRKSHELYGTQIDTNSKNCNALYASIDAIPLHRKRNSVASSASFESSAMADESASSGASSTTYSSGFSLHIESNGLPFSHNFTLPLNKDVKMETLKSPFEEEPLYQFYHKDVQQRATLWYATDGSESEFEDYGEVKTNLNHKLSPVKAPVLQTQRSAMDLVHGEGGQRTLWCEVPEVQKSGILEKLSPQDRKIQEAMFEVITSEASYLKSLNFLLEHFVSCSEFRSDATGKRILDKREHHILFSDVQPVRDVSASLLADLEKRWLENIVMSNVCDIIYHHASKYFLVYVKYCSNQIYQDRTLKHLRDTRPQFNEVLKSLESNTVCQGLDMHSFLMLPMQRITRLPMLVDAIFHRLDIDSSIYESCKMALALLNKLVAECNESARKMERMEEMLVISHQLDFGECKGLGVLSASRWLVKKGELIQLVFDSNNKRTFGKTQRWCKIRLFLFLFTDLLVITRKKSDDTYCVVDYCPRNMVQVMLMDENMPLLQSRLPSGYRNVFQLIMLSNCEGKTTEMLLSCILESDRTRWMDAVTPPKSENPDEKIYEEWDCPQVQCTHVYSAQQNDELSIEEADVVNVFRKMSDGWFEGERIRDGIRGWFPSSHAMEIVSSHVRARNLRQRYRLLMLSQTYLEEQEKALAANKSK